MENFNSAGKNQGAAIMFNDEVNSVSRIRQEANGGFTIQVTNEDEFGNETRFSMTFDRLDFEIMKTWVL